MRPDPVAGPREQVFGDIGLSGSWIQRCPWPGELGEDEAPPFGCSHVFLGAKIAYSLAGHTQWFEAIVLPKMGEKRGWGVWVMERAVWAVEKGVGGMKRSLG